MAGDPTRHGVRRWHSAVPRLSVFIIEHLLLLPLGVAVALIWANTYPESYYRFSYAAAFATNDVGMTFFFGLMMKEVVEATAPGGVLHRWRRVLLPIVAAIGATVVPAVLHIWLTGSLFDEPMLRAAWPVSLVTELAFVYLTVRLIFGKAHAAIPFAILLTIAADAVGFGALAIISPTRAAHWMAGIAILVLAMLVAAGLRFARVKSFWPYLLVPGAISWFALYWSGLHPALALVPILPFAPHAARDPGFFVDAAENAPDALSQFEVFWRIPVQVVLFFFGLVNAGITLGALELGTSALPIAVLVGKPVGIMLGVGVGMLAGLHMPHRLGWRDVIVVGFSAAISLGIGLFFCSALIAPGQLRAETSMGVLLTVAGLPIAVVAAKLLGAGRYCRSA